MSATPETTTPGFKPKKSVALSGTAAGNTALCTVGRTGNDLAYRGYDILDVATTCEFEEIAHLLVHGKLPNVAELAGYKAKLKSLRGIPAAVKSALAPSTVVSLDVAAVAESRAGNCRVSAEVFNASSLDFSVPYREILLLAAVMRVVRVSIGARSAAITRRATSSPIR